MDDDDENLVDWGYDDDVEEVVDASGPIEDEDDILASDGEHDSPRTTQPQPPPTSECLLILYVSFYVFGPLLFPPSHVL